MNKRFEQVDKRLEQMDKRFEQMMSFIWILPTIFAAMTVGTIGFPGLSPFPLPLAKKFVFLANVYTVLIKCGKGLSGEQGTPCPPSSYDLFNLYFVFVCIVSEQPSP